MNLLRKLIKESIKETIETIEEEIRQVKKGCYKVYPEKPKKGKKRREALSKKCKTLDAAKKQLAAIEISKSMNEENDMSISLKELKDIIRDSILDEKKKKRKKVDYKKAYKKYHSSPKAKKERAQRNAARRAIEKAGIKIPKGYEVDHKNPISNGGSNNPSNLRIIPREENRSDGQKITTQKRKKKGKY